MAFLGICLPQAKSVGTNSKVLWQVLFLHCYLSGTIIFYQFKLDYRGLAQLRNFIKCFFALMRSSAMLWSFSTAVMLQWNRILLQQFLISWFFMDFCSFLSNGSNKVGTTKNKWSALIWHFRDLLQTLWSIFDVCENQTTSIWIQLAVHVHHFHW